MLVIFKKLQELFNTILLHCMVLLKNMPNLVSGNRVGNCPLKFKIVLHLEIKDVLLIELIRDAFLVTQIKNWKTD